MKAIVSIHGHAVGRLEYQGQPILTFPMIDELHERRKNASFKAFRENKEMLVEGTDYFDVPFLEWSPLLKEREMQLQKAKKPILNVRETDVQDVKMTDLNVGETHVQDEEMNLEFPFPCSPQPAASSAAEIPAAAAKNTSTAPKHRQQKLPLPEVKKHGGRRGNMYFLTASGYALLVKVFNDPLSWEIQRELVRSYFGQSKGRSKRLSA